MSKLYYRYGVMGSAKSTILLTQAYSFDEHNIPFLCLKSVLDTRANADTIESRIGIKRDCVSINVDDDIFELINRYVNRCIMTSMPKPMWILVDESQFLSAVQVEQLSRVVDDLGINVYCYGLRTDFTTNLFEGSRRLMELADDIDELKICCSCGRKAILNARVDGDGQIMEDGEQILIGGNEMYVPLCRKCYREKLNEKKNKNLDVTMYETGN